MTVFSTWKGKFTVSYQSSISFLEPHTARRYVVGNEAESGCNTSHAISSAPLTNFAPRQSPKCYNIVVASEVREPGSFPALLNISLLIVNGGSNQLGTDMEKRCSSPTES